MQNKDSQQLEDRLYRHGIPLPDDDERRRKRKLEVMRHMEKIMRSIDEAEQEMFWEAKKYG